MGKDLAAGILRYHVKDDALTVQLRRAIFLRGG